MRFFWISVFSLLLFACSNLENGSLLNTDVLETQVYSIDINKDTVLKTANGAIIKIGKGSFAGADGNVQLEVKEAYSMEDIIKAGLTTQSDGRPLRSGGMIYVNATDKNVSISKPIEVSIPSDSYDEQMKLFKGNMEDGKMNWKEPEPLKDSTSPYLLAGARLFNQNCATCHEYQKELTGTPMRGLESRGPWKDRKQLFAFTRNPGSYIPRTCYTKNLMAQYNGQVMPSFPQLTDADLNAVYDYIRNLDIENGINLTNNYANGPCDDSCYRFDSIRLAAQEKIDDLNNSRKALVAGNENRINYERLNSTGTQPMINNRDNGVMEDKVVPDEFKAIYYRFDIKSFGWHNIDALLETAKADASSLSVQVDNSLSEEWDLFIAVPSQKVFDRGGKLANGEDYGFFTKDGKIPLNPGTRIIVFTLGEAKGQIAFDYQEFTSTGKDVIKLQPKLVSKEEFNQQVKTWTMEKVTIAAGDSKNANEIRKVDDEIKKQQKMNEDLRPKSCDCNCGASSADSTQQKESPQVNAYLKLR